MEDKLLIRKALDTLSLSEKYSTLRATGFLDPKEQSEIKKDMPRSAGIISQFYGGYPDAERNMFVCCPDWEEDPEYPIAILKVTGRDTAKLTHRDYLGSVLGLGLKREKIGDILVGEETYLFVSEDIKEYICENLTKIGSVGVSVSMVETADFILPTPKFKEIVGSVASFRLDVILALALSESRSKIQKLIEAERVQVNYEVAVSPSKTLSPGDKISVRGYGKMLFENIGGNSKKGRPFITIKRYI